MTDSAIPNVSTSQFVADAASVRKQTPAIGHADAGSVGHDVAPADANAPPASTNLPDGPPMPEMREGQLDTAQVEQLFADLAACTQILAILEKGGKQDHATSSHPDLAAARDRFLHREVLAVQIRYRYDNTEWIDTLLHSPTGVRAVSCRQTG